jgi:hypothetical protein
MVLEFFAYNLSDLTLLTILHVFNAGYTKLSVIHLQSFMKDEIEHRFPGRDLVGTWDKGAKYPLKFSIEQR